MTKDEALKRAFDWYGSGNQDPDEFEELILSIVAQPAQEPVAYSYTSRITGAQGFSHHPMPRFIDSESWDIKPLYTSPPASKPWLGLTAQDRYQAIRPLYNSDGNAWLAVEHSNDEYEAIEAKLREKNAAPCKPLTDEEILAVAADIWGSILIAPQSYQAFARAIEAAHGIKEDA